MFNILAQAGELAVGGGLLAAGGGVVWVGQKIFTRQTSKLLDHPDDNSRHIAPGDEYVDSKMCDIRFQSLVGHIESIHTDVREIRKKVDTL